MKIPPRSASLWLLSVVFLISLDFGGLREVFATRASPEDGDRLSRTPDVTVREIGKAPGGEIIHEATLLNRHGIEVKVLSYGATLTSVRTPDREGRFKSVTLHLDSLDDYLKGHPLLGSIVGRFANRIAGARLEIDGEVHRLERNSRGENHIHGGREGFQKRIWTMSSTRRGDSVGVRLELRSPHGDAGYPGNLDVRVTYWLTPDDELRIEYSARTDRPTHLNLTNHAYFNLAGAGSGTVLDQVLFIDADRALEARGRFPTGKILELDGSPLDFRRPRAIGDRVKLVEGENYDDCYVLRGGVTKHPRLVARARDPASGRTLEVLTTQPGVQLYTAKHLGPGHGTRDRRYGPYHGFCLETQHFPDSPNHPHFPTTLLRPEEAYEHETIFRFGVED